MGSLGSGATMTRLDPEMWEYVIREDMPADHVERGLMARGVADGILSRGIRDEFKGNVFWKMPSGDCVTLSKSMEDDTSSYGLSGKSCG
jgi:hypothetical protein